MPPAIRLVLVRHGEVDANREMRYLGRGDPSLNHTGRRQAEALAASLAALAPDRILTSPLARARATADVIAARTGSVPRTDPRLREMDFGDWEGLTRTEVLGLGERSQRDLLAWEADPELAPPHGESLAAVQTRVLELANELVAAAAGSTAALVSHVGPIKALLCAALGLGLAATRRVFLDPASVSVVDWGTMPVVRLVNSPAEGTVSSARWLRHGP